MSSMPAPTTPADKLRALVEAAEDAAKLCVDPPCTRCPACRLLAAIDALGPVDELVVELRGEVTKQLEAVVELFSFLEIPLRNAIRQARPSPGAPSNVDVYWRTGSDTVAAMLRWLDAARSRAQED